MEPNQSKSFIPIRVYWKDGQPWVDWCHLGGRRLVEPFFTETIEACLGNPAMLLFRPQTPLAELEPMYRLQPGLDPAGFIFHMSRCGSTLAARMLASSPAHVVLSEAEPIDGILKAHLHHPEVARHEQVAWLRWMASALGQQRRPEERRLFIKLDSWHTLFLPLVREAFPAVPWIFVYRDPVEVMVSHARRPGSQMMPGGVMPRLLGLEPVDAMTMPPREYCARVLARICAAALLHREGGMLVNYSQLPQVMGDAVMAFFGADGVDAESMRAAARFDAKAPSSLFVADGAAKQGEASAEIRARTAALLQSVYDQLEAARLAQRP